MKTKDKLLAEFRKKIVMSLNELMELFNRSPATVNRYLDKWGSFNSLNSNILSQLPSIKIKTIIYFFMLGGSVLDYHKHLLHRNVVCQQ
jgi:hypothetical protein